MAHRPARLAWTSLALALTACSSRPPTPPPPAIVQVPPPAAPATESPPSAPPVAQPASVPAVAGSFGGERWGFVEASSADGRLVVLRRFEGAARPQFGHHGESSSADDLALFDSVAHTETALEEIIDVEPNRRFMLLLNQGKLWLADSQSGALLPLAGADMNADHNACLSPRQANFSPEGKRVGWIVGNGLRVRDLASSQEWVITTKERLWRGWPEDDSRGAFLGEVPAGSADWPLQGTSCACRWCNRFALSYSTFGWSGPSFEIVHVAEDGTRAKSKLPESTRRWHDKTTAGCTLKAASEEHGLAHGPWRWVCGAP
ncbi:MAG: hypothetical protein U0359_37060 [Byssovorax sp.]